MLGRFGRPGLLGTIARTAVVAGTASAVNRAVNRAADNRQQIRYEADAYRTQQAQAYRPQQPPPAPPIRSSATDVITKLQQLSALHDSGALSDQEFAAAKAKLLS